MNQAAARVGRVSAGDAGGIAVGTMFEAVVKGRQCHVRAVSMTERQQDQMVGEMRVLWEQRAVQVCSVDVAGNRTLGPVLTVVAVPGDDMRQRRRAVLQVGTAAMILEADQTPECGLRSGECGARVGDFRALYSARRTQDRLDVADAARDIFAGVHGAHREDAEAG